MRVWSYSSAFLDARPFSIDRSKTPHFDNIVLPNSKGSPFSLLYYDYTKPKVHSKLGPALDLDHVKVLPRKMITSGKFNIPLSFPAAIRTGRRYSHAYIDPYSGLTRFYRVLRSSALSAPNMGVQEKSDSTRPCVCHHMAREIHNYSNLYNRPGAALLSPPEIHYSFDAEGQAFFLLLKTYRGAAPNTRLVLNTKLYLYKMGVDQTTAGWDVYHLELPRHPNEPAPACDNISIRFFSVKGNHIYVAYDNLKSNTGGIFLTRYLNRPGFDLRSCRFYPTGTPPFMKSSDSVELWAAGQQKNGVVSYENVMSDNIPTEPFLLSRPEISTAPAPLVGFTSSVVKYNQPGVYILGSIHDQLLLLDEKTGEYYRASVNEVGKVYGSSLTKLGLASRLMGAENKTAKVANSVRKSLYVVFLENKGFLGAGKKKVMKEILLSNKTIRQLRAAGIPVAQRRNTLSATFSNMKGTPIEITLYLNDIPGKKRSFFIDINTWVDIFVNKANIQTAIERYPILAVFRYASTQQRK